MGRQYEEVSNEQLERFSLSEIINLRQARKRLARTAREGVAATNRARHGRTKAERALQHSEAEQLRKSLDGAKHDDPQG
ncbi:MAG: hypothetical protein JWM91_3270 [Rhodospirillales bacterium]|nr:hypothetical protein [Rhodospirillales bacterium]